MGIERNADVISYVAAALFDLSLLPSAVFVEIFRFVSIYRSRTGPERRGAHSGRTNLRGMFGREGWPLI